MKMTEIDTKGNYSPGIVGRDYNQQTTNIFIRDSLLFFKNFKDLFYKIKTPIKHYFDNKKIGFDNISDKYFSKDFENGQQITVEGYLSSYMLTYRDNFYSPYLYKAGKTTIEETIVYPKSGHVKMDIESKPAQLPIQNFPPIKLTNETIYIYFLYDSSISSFILETDQNKIQTYNEIKQVDDILKIDNTHMPIIVISGDKLHNESEKIVKITGIIKEFDKNVLDIFAKNITKTQRTIMYNTFRPFNEGYSSLCLDLRDKSRSKISVLSSKDSFPATIYAESHFENITKIPNFQKILGISMPKAYPGLHWCGFNNTGITFGLCDSNIIIATKDCSYFAFYIESDLKKRDVYMTRLSELSFFINKFRQNVQKIYRQFAQVEVKNKFDFLFDYTKASVFHPDGILISKEIEALLENTSSLSTTIDWLKNVK